MTRPRIVTKGSCILITKSCFGRHFLLKPDPAVVALFLTAVAAAASKYGLELLGACQMSNHYHLVMHDAQGQYPRFVGWLNAALTRGINRLRRRRDTLWEARQTSIVELGDADSVLEAMAYVHLNPMAAGLVEEARSWAGVLTGPGDFEGGAEVASGLELRVPPTHEHLSRAAFAALFRARVEAIAAELRLKSRARGRSPATADSLKEALKRSSAAKSRAPRRTASDDDRDTTAGLAASTSGADIERAAGCERVSHEQQLNFADTHHQSFIVSNTTSAVPLGSRAGSRAKSVSSGADLKPTVACETVRQEGQLNLAETTENSIIISGCFRSLSQGSGEESERGACQGGQVSAERQTIVEESGPQNTSGRHLDPVAVAPLRERVRGDLPLRRRTMGRRRRPARAINPTVKAASAERRAGLLKRLLAFREAYARALTDLRSGLTVTFPGGTWQVCQDLNQPSEPSPLPAWRL